jgi:hypothetical protein
MKVTKPLVHVVKFDHGHINTPFESLNFEDEEKSVVADSKQPILS